MSFNPRGGHTLTTDITHGSGTITLQPGQEEMPYPAGTVISALAKTDENNLFGSWGGYLSGTFNPIYFRVGADTMITQPVFVSYIT